MRQAFDGKVALITGAGGRRGIGRASALRLARDGADVVLLDIGWPKAQRPVDEQQDDWRGVASVAEEVEALGRRALAIEADVSDEAQVGRAVAAALERFGRIDLLVANAGARPGADRVPVVDLDADVLRHLLGVNLVGSFLCCKAVGRHLVARGEGGAVVIVSSASGRVGKPRLAAYAASKFGQIGLMQAFAMEMAPHGVRVNAVCPGIIDTARLDWSAQTLENGDRGSAQREREGALGRWAREIPLGRVGTADDVAATIAFLCSEDARHITGQSLGIDGGSRM